MKIQKIWNKHLSNSNVVNNCLKELPKGLELFSAERVSYFSDDIIHKNFGKSNVEILIIIIISWVITLIIIFLMASISLFSFVIQRKNENKN